MSTKSEFLRQYEHMIYRMAMTLLHDDEQAVAVTKEVLCQLWQDNGFFKLDERKQLNRLIWLVSCATSGIDRTA